MMTKSPPHPLSLSLSLSLTHTHSYISPRVRARTHTGPTVVGNCKMLQKALRYIKMFVSVTQGSTPVSHVTPPTSALPMPLVMPTARAFVTAGFSKITGRVTHVSVSFRRQIYPCMIFLQLICLFEKIRLVTLCDEAACTQYYLAAELHNTKAVNFEKS